MPRLLDKLGEELRHRVSLLTTPAAKTRVIHTRVNDCDLLVRANEGIVRAIHHARNFELLETQFLKSVIGPDAVCFDVGANIGQHARELRKLGYGGDIVSFEPLSSAHALLVAASAGDARWTVAPRAAIGAQDGSISINIAGNSVSSSVLDMLDSHADAAPESRYTGQESVEMARLDSVAARYLSPASQLFIKVDTQGYEAAVLAGAPATLARTAGVQLELSLLPLYAGQALFEAIIAQMRDAGFEIWTLWPGFADPATGRMLQIDALFVRREPQR